MAIAIVFDRVALNLFINIDLKFIYRLLMNESFTDTFTDNRPSGKTIGTKTDSGVLRKGIDREKAIAIDHNALRFQPLIKPGWNRQAIAYGKYRRQNGLAVAVLLLNGHNTSQAETIEWLYKRIPRWLRGSETESISRRIVAWLGSKHKSSTPRRLLGWFRIAAEVTKFFPLPKLDDNLAIGWSTQITENPTTGNSFVVRATGAENGELLVRVGNNLQSVFRGLQNVPVYYVVVLREKGAAYYAASLPQVYGLPAYPQFRPVAIDALDSETSVYAGIHQSVLGQIGFRADTRVFGVKVETVANLANWYSTAYLADTFIGRENITATSAEVGGSWQVLSGSLERTNKGLSAINNGIAIIDRGVTSGLIHLAIQQGLRRERASELNLGDSPFAFAEEQYPHSKATLEQPQEAIATEANIDIGIIWRFKDAENYWCCRLNNERFYLQLTEAGRTTDILISDRYPDSNPTAYLQILDDGREIGIYLNGRLIGDRIFNRQLATATGVGIAVFEANPNLYLHHFEAHPRTVAIPELDLGVLWWREGTEVIIRDNFQDGIKSGRDLAGTTTSLGDRLWQKTLGTGVFKVQSGMAKVDASVEYPNRDRTAYTVAWSHPLADVSVTILPPGKERGHGDKGRGGLIFWQDKDNYIIINTWLDDFYDGESISCFFRIDGFEEIYDAVWSNIGKAIAFGQPYTLRVVFDGNNYTVRVNNQTVLYRALTDVYPWANNLTIARIGIVANWEWGNDTGSSFSDFVAKK